MPRVCNCELRQLLIHALERMYDISEGVSKSFTSGKKFEGVSITERCERCSRQYVLAFMRDRRGKER